MPVHISSASPFFSSSIGPSCASVLFPSTWSGWEPPTYTSCCHQLLLNQALLRPLVLLKVPFSQPGTQRALFLPSCSHIFFSPPSKPGWTQLLSSQGAQRKLSQAANWLAELLHLFIREQSWCRCLLRARACACVRVNTVSLGGSINIECTVIVAELLLRPLHIAWMRKWNSLNCNPIGQRKHSRNLIGGSVSQLLIAISMWYWMEITNGFYFYSSI